MYLQWNMLNSVFSPQLDLLSPLIIEGPGDLNGVNQSSFLPMSSLFKKCVIKIEVKLFFIFCIFSCVKCFKKRARFFLRFRNLCRLELN